ncbi:MAG: hypothetical protein ACE5H3_04260 [Planctomycetota bacterium]
MVASATERTGQGPEGRRLLTGWVRATFLGWLLGVVLVVLAAMGGDWIGNGEEDSQWVVGLGMGAGVGFAQGRVARRWLEGARHWVWTTLLGMALPFAVFDFFPTVSGQLGEIAGVLLEVAIGAFLAGLLQQRILRRHFDRALWWIPACVAGWTLAAAFSAGGSLLAGSGPGRGLLLALHLAAILGGGMVLGLVTGGALVWMRRGRGPGPGLHTV